MKYVLFAMLVPGLAFAGPRDVIVKFADQSYALSAQAGLAAQAVTVGAVRRINLTGAEVWDVGDADRLSVCSMLKDEPGVIYATPDRLVSVAAVPNDSAFAQQWQHQQNDPAHPTTFDVDMDSPEAWDTYVGDANVPLIAVIDTGVRLTAGGHPDLNPNLWINPNEIPGNGIDDDGNGKIDDVQGWDFGGDGITQDNLPHDNNGHGTHVTGIIAAVGNNIIGVSGVLWHCKIMPLKFTIGINDYGYFGSVAEAMDYARMMGAKIINGSFGSEADDPAMHDAVTACVNAGMICVFAAGNDARDLDCCPTSCGFYPAAYDDPGVISVGASTRDDWLSYFTDWGATKVDLFAPGSLIYSTLNQSPHYGTKSGTSMAAPQVTGACGLVWGKNPALTRDQVISIILGSVEVKPRFIGKCVSNGRLNLKNALDMTPLVGVGMPTRGAPTIERTYDIQGRQIDAAIRRSGVTFTRGTTTKKRATVK